DKKKKDRLNIVIRKGNSRIWRNIEGTAINFLKEELEIYLEHFKFRNPFPKETVILPGEDITREQLESKPRSRKGFLISEFYSSGQKKKYITMMLENFFDYYHQIVHNNFFFIRKLLKLYSQLPLKMSIYINEKSSPMFNGFVDVYFSVFFERLHKKEESTIEFHINEEVKYDKYKHIYGYETSFLNCIISYKNPLPFIYEILQYDLEDIIQKIENYTIFEDLKPFEEPVVSWIQMILKAEDRGGETLNIELKRIPKEAKNKDGKGNDLYGHINAMENSDGGYIFIGVDESKTGLDKIVGLEPFFRDSNLRLDDVKRIIIDKCFKYLHKYVYKVEANKYNGKTLIRIKVKSNKGKISTFFPKNGDPCAFFRLNGKKIKMTPEQIAERAVNYQII
ncbi:MAG: helix-turn-helix domain-containing protein, partial [Promethearchaeota archaeon]